MSRHLTNLFIIASILLTLAILSGLVWGNAFYARALPGEGDLIVSWIHAPEHGQNRGILKRPFLSHSTNRFVIYSNQL